jgi:hypothetical protein
MALDIPGLSTIPNPNDGHLGKLQRIPEKFREIFHETVH